MAPKCSVIGCFGNGTRRGLCQLHYGRLRRSGTAGEAQRRQSINGTAVIWVQELLSGAPKSECILWPFARSDTGYGSIFIEGKSTSAHRYVCKLAHGMPTFARAQVAHSCGNRLCVNPAHVRWADQSSNESDKVAHGLSNRGERHGMAKLTSAQVREIRRRGDTGEAKSSIARDFGIARKTASEIIARKKWAHVEEEPHGI